MKSFSLFLILFTVSLLSFAQQIKESEVPTDVKAVASKQTNNQPVTMEYTAKMLYEKTIGKIFSWFSNGTPSDEEKIIFQAHRAYSDFIYDQAWYEFDFMPWVKKVWSESNKAESNWLRKMERKLFFTLEFTFKAGYAKIIEWGAKANYEEPVTQIYLLISTTDSLNNFQDLRIIHEEDDKKIISITRWGAFTKTVLGIAEKNIDISEIGGNDEIIVSVLTHKDESGSFAGDNLLYTSKVVTKNDHERRVYLLPVARLLPFVKGAKEKDVEVEHIFDY